MTTEVVTAGPPRITGFMLFLTRGLNVLFALVLHSPLHGMLSDKFMLLSFKGRRSGKKYTLVVGYVREGNVVTVISPRGWWKNLRGENTTVRVLLQKKWSSGVAETFYGNEQVAGEFGRLAQKFPSLLRMYRIEQGLAGQPKSESIHQATQKLAVIRIRLVKGEAILAR